jgi:hypothetical protein
MKLMALAALGAVVGFGIQPALATSMRDRPDANDVGIWKSYSPHKKLHGEFNNYDPVGLMAGALIQTDCSINYTDPDTRKTYCFNSATSQVYFSNWPKTYAAKAAEALEKLKEAAPSQ